jgi:glycosyltransferase involved in cell wall biosynthesis
VICGHLHLLPLAWLLARVSGAHLTLIIHGIEAWSPSTKFLVRKLACRIDSLVAVSAFTAQRFSRWAGVSSERATVLPNSVDLDQFRPQPREPRLVARYGLQSRKVLLTVGRLAAAEQYKGFDQVVELMPALHKLDPAIKYLIVGDGDDRPRLEQKVRTLGLSDNVVFAGHIAEAEKVAHYNLADLYVMPSSGEGFGIVLIEAAACGIPVIGSRIDGSREALLDGKLGRLVDPRSAKELMKAIVDGLQFGSNWVRIDEVEAFSADKFGARVRDWVTQFEMTSAASMRKPSETAKGNPSQC